MVTRLTAASSRLTGEGLDLLVVPPGDDLLSLLSYSPHPDERPCAGRGTGESRERGRALMTE